MKHAAIPWTTFILGLLIGIALGGGILLARDSGELVERGSSTGSSPPEDALHPELGEKARVLGVGGVFFRARDPKGLGEWYRERLGMPVSHPHGANLKPETMPAGAFTVWAPFDQDTTYFDPADRQFMFNLVVDDLDRALAQVKQGGAEIVGDIEEFPYGRFGWFLDPEGNKVELWQPPVSE